MTIESGFGSEMSKFENLCPYCGLEMADGECPNGHRTKKMCLNCAHCQINDDGDLVCKNEENLSDAVEKAKEAIEGINGYKFVGELKMEPIPLKKPTTKCKRWELSEEMLKKFAESFE